MTEFIFEPCCEIVYKNYLSCEEYSFICFSYEKCIDICYKIVERHKSNSFIFSTVEDFIDRSLNVICDSPTFLQGGVSDEWIYEISLIIRF